MKRFTFTLALLAVVAFPFLASRPGAAFPDYRSVQARHPRADAVVLYDSLVVAADEAGRVARRYHRAVMLFTDNAINRYGDPRILYNADTQELRVVTARAHMRDGSTVDTKGNGINRTTPFELDRASDYTGWQETVVTHVGIEKGCVAELEYVIADLKASLPFGGVEIFSSEDPVERRVLVVRPPAGASVKAFVANGAPEAERSAQTLTWIVRDIPGRAPFDGGVWEGDYFPVVCYGTADSWNGALSKIASELAEASAAFPAAGIPVSDAVKDIRGDEERALAVHRLAMDAVRGIRVPYPLLASPPRAAARVYDTGYASPLDRAVLLAAMLRTAGYEPEFVLVPAGKAMSGDVPVVELFTKALVAVAAGDAGELLLDPASPYECDPSYALAGRTCARLGGGTPAGAASAPRLAPVPPRTSGASRSALELALAPGEAGTLAGTGRTVLTGAFSPYHIVRSGASLEEYVGTRVKRLLGGVELASLDIRTLDRSGAEVDFTFTVKLPDKKAGERAYFSLPKAFDAAVSGVDRVRLERSEMADAVRLEPCELDVSCAIELPAGWKFVALPPPASVGNDAGSSSVAVENAGGAKRVVRSKLRLERDIVTSAHYPSLRAVLAVLADDRIVIEKE